MTSWEDEEQLPDTWHGMRDRVLTVASVIPRSAEDRLKRVEQASRYGQIRRLIVDEAIQNAKDRGDRPGDDSAWDTVYQGSELADDLVLPLIGGPSFWDEEEFRLVSDADLKAQLSLIRNTPGHLLIHEIENNDPMPVDRIGFEAGVGAYLKGSVKSPEIDRFILTTLIQIEVSAYLERITRVDPWFQKISELQKVRSVKHPLVYWLSGRGFDLLIALVVIALGFAAHRYLGMPIIALVGISLVTAILYVGFAIFTLVRLPGASKQMAEAKKEYFDLIQTMISVYDEVPLNGPISVRRIREKAVSAEDRGAVWPKAIWPFFDDLASRNIEIL